VVRYLKDAGLLGSVTHLCSVSGGSILGAHLVQNWDLYLREETKDGGENEIGPGETARKDGRVTKKGFADCTEELIAFINLDIRNRIFRRFLSYFLPNLFSMTRTRDMSNISILQYYYSNYLYNGATASESLEGVAARTYAAGAELPRVPQFHILTTNVTNTGLCSFTNDGFSFDIDPDDESRDVPLVVPGGAFPLAMAVAASSAYPAMFQPVTLSNDNSGCQVDNKLSKIQELIDGGVYDNLGVRKFLRLTGRGADTSDVVIPPPVDIVLVSDAGRSIRHFSEIGLPILPIETALRASDVLMSRIGDLERERARRYPDIVFISLTDGVPNKPADAGGKYHDQFAPHPDLQRLLPLVRTDFDRFNREEISGLVRHGYCVARKALISAKDADKIPALRSWTPPGPSAPWDPRPGLPSSDASAPSNGLAEHPRIPPPEKERFGRLVLERRKQDLSEVKVLRKSSVRRWRFFAKDDIHSYVHVSIIIVLLFLPALGAYSRFKARSYAGDNAVRFVQELGDPSYDGFDIDSDSAVYDLRSWKRVEAGRRGERIQPAYYTRKLRLRREPGSSRLFLEFLTSGFTIDSFVCAQFPSTVLAASKTGNIGRHDTKKWNMIVDVSKAPENQYFDLEVSATYWNSFQGAQTEWVSLEINHPPPSKSSVEVLFPPSRTYKQLFDIKNYPLHEREVQKSEHGGLKEEDTVGHLSFKWSIDKPTANTEYVIQWTW